VNLFNQDRVRAPALRRFAPAPGPAHWPHLLIAALLGAALPPLAGAREVVVTQVVALSGPQAPVGKNLSFGIKLLLDDVNAKGGVNGNTVKLLLKDDGYKVADTVKLVTESAAADKPIALIAPLGTANIEALRPVITSEKLPIIGARSGASSIANHPFIFRNKATFKDETAKIVEQFTSIGFNSFGVVYQDDGLGKDGLSGVTAALEAHKLKPTVASAYERNTVKVESAVAEMLKVNPQCIVLAGVVGPTAAFVKQYRQGGGRAQLVSVSTIDLGLVIKQAGLEAARGFSVAQVMPNPAVSYLPIAREMRDLAKKASAPADAVNPTSLEGFITAKVFIEGLRRAGKDPSRESLVKGLETMDDYEAGGFRISYGPGKHDGTRYVELGVVDGRGKLME
jgi:ABC-type branched-subunit amino acid transport system substrate-binding protein